MSFFAETTLAKHLEALDQIGEIGSQYDAMYVLKYVFSNKKSIPDKAAQVIQKLMTKQPIKVMQHRFSDEGENINSGYIQIAQEQFKRISSFEPKYAVHLYGLVSMNNSGYIREKALHYLEKVPSSEALPYLLLRLNDWVPQISAKALQVIDHKISMTG